MFQENEQRKALRARVKQAGGKTAYIRAEMVRLGFWSEEDEQDESPQLRQAEQALAQLVEERDQLDADIEFVQDVESMIQEIRTKRIERSREQRRIRKEEKARAKAVAQEKEQQRRRREPPYLGPGVSAGLHYHGGKPSRVSELGLPRLRHVEELAEAIGTTPEEIAWLAWHAPAAKTTHYTRFTIPKRSGGHRLVSAPKGRLRRAQTWILRQILQHIEIHPAATAFREGGSILQNALPHTSQAIVIRLDLKDFFPSISFHRVKGIFQGFGYSEGISSVLALLCTEAPRLELEMDGEVRQVATGERQLPQGACTSPALSNILARRLDRRLAGLAANHGFVYTRYADDLVFSHPKAEANVGRLLASARHIIRDEGLVVNEDKTTVMRQHQRQAITGIVVNEVPRISRRDLRRFRAMLHRYETQGAKTLSEQLGCNAEYHVRGYYSFVRMVNEDQADRLLQRHPWLAGEGGET